MGGRGCGRPRAGGEGWRRGRRGEGRISPAAELKEEVAVVAAAVGGGVIRAVRDQLVDLLVRQAEVVDQRGAVAGEAGDEVVDRRRSLGGEVDALDFVEAAARGGV